LETFERLQKIKNFFEKILGGTKFKIESDLASLLCAKTQIALTKVSIART